MFYKSPEERFRSERRSRSSGHGEKARSIVGMRTLKGISGQENFPLGAAQGVRAVRRGRFLKGRVRVRCTDKRGAAGDELPQWELIILLREARSGRADKQQAPHPM